MEGETSSVEDSDSVKDDNESTLISGEPHYAISDFVFTVENSKADHWDIANKEPVDFNLK